MLNKEYKDQALKMHEKAVEKYNKTYTDLSSVCESLYTKRVKSVELIGQVEEIINSISNRPHEFERKLEKIEEEKMSFHQTEEYAKEAYDNAIKTGIGTAAGIGAGIGVAGVGPTAAMWIATTFGSASTGTAISTLSGAAATKAALAWLGGGALKVGGAGIVGGKALLALAGPIGWGITGVAIVGEGFLLSQKNKSIGDRAKAEANEITRAGWHLNAAKATIEDLIAKSELVYSNLAKQYNECLGYKGSDYSSLEESVQYKLGSLVNDTLVLAELLNKTVDSNILE